MGLKVAEFFAELGVQGSEKAIDAISTVKKGMGELGSMSLEAKAAIVGAFYAIEQLFSASGQAGTNLKNFTALTDISAQTLQRYQFAARQTGVSNQEVATSFQNLQSVVAKTLRGEGAPKGLGLVAPTIGMSNADFWNSMKDPSILLQNLQKFARSNVAPAMRNEILKSFGLGDAMIAAMTQNAFRPDVLSRAPTYSDKEINNLNRANIAWGNLGEKIEMAIGHFNALHGGQIVNDITKLVDPVMRLVEALTILADKAKVFELLGKSVQGWAQILEGARAPLTSKGRADIANATSDIVTGNSGLNYLFNYKDMVKDLKNSISPPSHPIHLNQTFTGKADPGVVQDAAHKGVKDAIHQNSALTAVN